MLHHSATVNEALVLRPLLEDRGHITGVNPYPGVRRQNETEMFSDHDETSSINLPRQFVPSIISNGTCFIKYTRHT